jgi:hypothetical protein
MNTATRYTRILRYRGPKRPHRPRKPSNPVLVASTTAICTRPEQRSKLPSLNRLLRTRPEQRSKPASLNRLIAAIQKVMMIMARLSTKLCRKKEADTATIAVVGIEKATEHHKRRDGSS